MEGAKVDIIHNGKAHGDVAQRLLAANFDVRALRGNDVLLYDEWKEFDGIVLREARLRLVAVGDLLSRGLVYNIPNGLGKTVIGYQDANELEAADVSMDGITKTQRDRPEFDMNYLPLPIIHKDFFYSAREIASSRNGNMPLDTTTVELASRQVSEKAEEFLVTGASAYTFGSGTIRGYLDAPQRNTETLSVNWDGSAITGALILDDVRAMKQASIDARHFGPWMLYIPTAYETALDDDFKTNSDKTIRQRILEIEGIQGIKVLDKLTANNVLLVQMTADVCRMVEGLPVTTVQWDTDGGMRINFKVMTILIPQIRNTQGSRSGITHLS